MKAGTPGRAREHAELVSQREDLRGKRRAGAEANDGEQSKEEQHSRQRYPRSPSSHTKRKSMYNHVYGIVGRDKDSNLRPPGYDQPSRSLGIRRIRLLMSDAPAAACYKTVTGRSCADFVDGVILTVEVEQHA